MKIKDHRQREYCFWPVKGKTKRFKKKSSLMKFLNNNFEKSLNGTVSLFEDSFTGSYTVRQWQVWFNDRCQYMSQMKIQLRQIPFRGKKFIHKPSKVSKSSKKYFAFSEKRISLMSRIEAEDGTINPNDAKKLVNIFYKSGFKDFIPDEDDLRYINGHISDGIQFSYWSDRCDYLRMKTIIEYFKRENLI